MVKVSYYIVNSIDIYTSAIHKVYYKTYYILYKTENYMLEKGVFCLFEKCLLFVCGDTRKTFRSLYTYSIGYIFSEIRRIAFTVNVLSFF